MTTTKLLPLTTFVAAAMSFAIPAWADDYTQTGDSTIGTDLLCYFDDADDDASAMKLGEKMLDEDALAFAFYASHATSLDSNGFASGSMLAFSGTEILERVETTQSTSTTLNGALTLASANSETVTVRQSAVATMRLSSDNSTEQYATDAGKSYYEQVSTSDSGSAVTTYSTVSFLGNFDSVGDTGGSYGTSTIDSGIVYYANRTWTGDGDENKWSGEGNWSGNTWSGTSNNATFNATGVGNIIVTVDTNITAVTITVTGDTDYTFNYDPDASLTVTSSLIIGNSSDDSSSLTITGGTNTFKKSNTNVNVYLGYASNSSGSLTITGGTNEFANNSLAYLYIGYASNSSGSLTITGGTNKFSSYLYIGYASNSSGSLTISGGENTFSSIVRVGNKGSGTMTIDDGTNTFSNALYVGNDSAGNGEITINGGNNEFSSNIELGQVSSSSGSLTITGGENKFSVTNFFIGYASSSSGSLTISGGKNTFSCTSGFYIGYASSSSGSLTISGGENTFSNTVHVGYNGTGSLTIDSVDGTTGGETTFSSLDIGYSSNVGTVIITAGNTTISGTTTIANNNSSLTVSGGTLTIEQKIGTDTKGSVEFSGSGQLIISGALLDSIEALAESGEAGSVAVICANTISFGGTEFRESFSDDATFNALINQYVSAGNYVLSWAYDGNGTLSVVAAVAPEPSMFGMFFGLSALGLVSTRRRRRA